MLQWAITPHTRPRTRRVGVLAPGSICSWMNSNSKSGKMSKNSVFFVDVRVSVASMLDNFHEETEQ
jgi:hypothetical protein